MDLRLFSRIPRLPIQQSYFLLADVWKKKIHWMDKIMWQTLGWSLKGGNGVSPAPVNICSVSWPEEPFVHTLKKNVKVFILWVFKKREFSSVKTQFLTRCLCGFEGERQIRVTGLTHPSEPHPNAGKCMQRMSATSRWPLLIFHLPT